LINAENSIDDWYLIAVIKEFNHCIRL